MDPTNDNYDTHNLKPKPSQGISAIVNWTMSFLVTTLIFLLVGWLYDDPQDRLESFLFVVIMLLLVFEGKARRVK